MSHEGDLSHRQEREQKKEEHAHPTRGKYLSSKHLTWVMVVGVILTGAAAIDLDLPAADVEWLRLSDQRGDIRIYRGTEKGPEAVS